jgi:SAM-dependent MidA family methyltransferase
VSLRQKIERETREHGPISFSRYMEVCLYDPELGYYSRNAEQFGKAGDFYTSSDVHAVFGRLLARQFEELWRVLGSPSQIEILELGPGRGLFAQDVLDWSEKKFPAFFAAVHYSLGEGSPALRRRLQTTLERHFAAGKASLCSDGKVIAREGATSVVPNAAAVERALAPEIPIIVFANEFFDALPVEVLSLQGELRISENDGRLLETWQPASVEALEFLDRYGVHPQTGERIEALLIAQRYMSQIAAAIKRGFIIAIDYGYTRQEQLAGRHRGTIAAYRQHSMSANPYEAPGEQDITAHVNFTALGAAAEVQGMQVQPLLTQSQFLLGIGEHNQFADAFEECRLPQEHAKVALQLKHLVTPEGMGESFQVLVASKGISAELVSKLSGLTFGKTTRP